MSPATIAFETIYSAALATLTASPIVQVTGLSQLAAVQLDANANLPAYRICADAACAVVTQDWQSSVGALGNNAFLQLRLTSASSQDTAVTMTVHVGSGSATFAVNSKSYCELAFTQTDHYSGGVSIDSQNGWSVSQAASFDEQIVNLGAGAQSGQSVWKLSNKVVSGGFGNQPLSPQLSQSAGESTVRSAGGGDAMETVFWVHSVSPTADGSSIVISMSPPAGNRLSYFRIVNDLDTNGGYQAKVIDYYDVQNTGVFRTFVPSSGMSRTAWTKVRLVLETPDGGTNDIFRIFLNDQLAGTYSSWEDYDTWTLGGNSVTEAVNRLLFRVSVAPSAVNASFVDANAQGFYFDNLCYRVYNRASSSSTIQSYRTGFEP